MAPASIMARWRRAFATVTNRRVTARVELGGRGRIAFGYAKPRGGYWPRIVRVPRGLAAQLRVRAPRPWMGSP